MTSTTDNAHEAVPHAISEAERSTLVNALYSAAQMYANMIKTCEALGTGGGPMATQFERQETEARAWAERIENAVSLVITDDPALLDAVFTRR
jgi:hypothetical protein